MYKHTRLLTTTNVPLELKSITGITVIIIRGNIEIDKRPISARPINANNGDSDRCVCGRDEGGRKGSVAAILYTICIPYKLASHYVQNVYT